MRGPFFSTKELAEYLDIHEKQVYKLVQRGALPGTRVTGKWLFPKDLVDRWIEATALETVGGALGEDQRLVVVAEPDHLVDLLLATVGRGTEALIARATPAMDGGLHHLERGRAHLALVEFTRGACRWPWPPQLARHLAGRPCRLVHVARREIVVAWLGRRAVRSLADLEGRRVAVRAPGAATRTLLDHRMLREGGDPSRLHPTPYGSHLDAALAVVRGEAELAVVPADEAHRVGLDGWSFASLDLELVVLDEIARWRAVEHLVEVVTSPAWRSLAEQRPGVDASSTGAAHTLNLMAS